MNTTEMPSRHRHLEKMDTLEILEKMNEEDHLVPKAVKETIPTILPLVDKIVEQMNKGGRLFYIGAGTSGRLGILDASECPPTFGVGDDWVIGLIAGGDKAIRKSVEQAEDDEHQAWIDLSAYRINNMDVVLGIAASGRTPYVVHGLKDCRDHGISTACITCNKDSPVTQYATYPIEVRVGPEFVTGSTRMKSGTAQKLILNMISTAVMIRLGRVMDNKMVDMQLSNNKLKERGARILENAFSISGEEARLALEEFGSVRKALESYKKRDN